MAYKVFTVVDHVFHQLAGLARNLTEDRDTHRLLVLILDGPMGILKTARISRPPCLDS